MYPLWLKLGFGLTDVISVASWREMELPLATDLRSVFACKPLMVKLILQFVPQDKPTQGTGCLSIHGDSSEQADTLPFNPPYSASLCVCVDSCTEAH